MVIWSEFRKGQDKDDDHREDAPHFKRLVGKFTLIHYEIYHQRSNLVPKNHFDPP